MRFSRILIPVLALITLFWGACSTDFDIYAPEKEIRAVYCVLNPSSPEQYIRITKGYQSNGDAIVFAGQNDLSLKGLTVKIKGAGVTYTAEQIDSFPKDEGMFFPTQTVYRIITDGVNTSRKKIVTGETYTLEIGAADSPEFITGSTTVPGKPTLRKSMATFPGAGTSTCLPLLAFDDKFQIVFDKTTAAAYEIACQFIYEKNFVADTFTWKSARPFILNTGCNDGANRMCYQFSDNYFIGQIGNHINNSGSDWVTYDTEDSCIVSIADTALLPRSLLFTARSVDQFLYNYMRVNDPANLDLTAAKPEYTNLQSQMICVGVFGSVNSDTKPAIMRPCSEYLLGLNGRPRPAGLCE